MITYFSHPLDPAYVRADCDLSYAAEHIMFLSNYNSGQSCFAVERIYVHESVYDAFLEKCENVLRKYKVDDPLLDDTTIGPGKIVIC